MEIYLAVSFGIVVFLCVWQIGKIQRIRDKNKNLNMAVEVFMDRLKCTQNELWKCEQHVVTLQEQLSGLIDERDELLVLNQHDEMELEIVFEDEEDADDFLASRRRAVDEIYLSADDMDHAALSDPSMDDIDDEEMA